MVEAEGLSDERWRRRFSLQVLRGRHPVGEGYGESIQGWLPPADPSCLSGALGVRGPGDQVERLEGSLLGGKGPLAVTARRRRGSASRLRFVEQSNLADLHVVVQKRRELLPRTAPQPWDRRVGLAPLLLYRLEGLLGRCHGGCGVDRLEVFGQFRPVPLGGKTFESPGLARAGGGQNAEMEPAERSCRLRVRSTASWP